MSKNNGDCSCINCLHSFRTENKLKSHENVCKNHAYCCVKVPEKFENILKYNRAKIYENSICYLRR